MTNKPIRCIITLSRNMNDRNAPFLREKLSNPPNGLTLPQHGYIRVALKNLHHLQAIRCTVHISKTEFPNMIQAQFNS